MVKEKGQILLGHIAIIMDGNRREGTVRCGDTSQGHIMGADAVEEAIKTCIGEGVSFLTLYAFSTENWTRSDEEVKLLMNLFRRFFSDKVSDLLRQGVRVKFIGRRDRLDADIVCMMQLLELNSSHNNELTVVIALDYGGRDEIVRAVSRLIWKVLTLRVNPFKIDEHTFSTCMDTSGIPDPDLVIRTGGERRLSGFLLWSLAYAELYFTEENWPSFNSTSLKNAIAWFQSRNRRFGGDVATERQVAAE